MTKEELEKENALLKGRNESFEQQIMGLIIKYEEVYKRFPDLKSAMDKAGAILKENAELKEKINILENCDRLGDMITEAYKEQLAQAKEFLNEFMRISKASDEDFEHDYSELIGETEQFIKDLEK